MSLSTRKENILIYIVQKFIESGEPISSRQIFKDKIFDIGTSTIRNEMLELEEKGLLFQPHISAGRIPTDSAFRFFVNKLLENEQNYNQIDNDFIDSIQKLYENRFADIRKKLLKLSKFLSKITNYTTIVLTPKYFLNSTISRIELVRVTEKKLILIIIEDSGKTHIEKISLNNKTNDIILQKNILKFNNFINDNIEILKQNKELDFNISFINITENVFKEIYLKTLKKISSYIINNRISLENIDIYGKTNLLNQPDINTVDNLKNLVTILNEDKNIKNILLNSSNEKLDIRIGNEIQNSLFSNFSLITANYIKDNNILSKISILGPKRMDYKKFISIMNSISNYLNE